MEATRVAPITSTKKLSIRAAHVTKLCALWGNEDISRILPKHITSSAMRVYKERDTAVLHNTYTHTTIHPGAPSHSRASASNSIRIRTT
ncbi:hypothetical protein HII31_00255 [Pseudocercospora fuligena]|uniref:Uncharacterized protein n=1 Tax=Pseudocercospora fuligena TaxID=685502 RepID=A0A8H6RYG6_9PEZI|nr:hypothetical protein HII31_00255 [Pseudocercospora fuligena]